MATFQVLYDMKFKGSIDVEADSEEEAERIVIEEIDYKKLVEEGGMPEIEAEAYAPKWFDDKQEGACEDLSSSEPSDSE